MKLNQNKTILCHWADGRTLTRLEAMVIHGIASITPRISELRLWLRRYDIEITVLIKTDPNGKQYAEYSLTAEAIEKLTLSGVLTQTHTSPNRWHVNAPGL